MCLIDFHFIKNRLINDLIIYNKFKRQRYKIIGKNPPFIGKIITFAELLFRGKTEQCTFAPSNLFNNLKSFKNEK
jgi:hypothetical protein